jgi:ADP-heptose:LPS heptosyltransferase
MTGVGPSVTRRILAYRAGGLGDTLLLLPALSALRRWAGRKGTLEVVGTMPYVKLTLGDESASRVHDASLHLFSGLLSEPPDADTVRFLNGFDAVVAWGDSLGLSAAPDPLEPVLFLESSLPPSGTHAVDHYLAAAGRLGAGAPAGVSATPSLRLSATCSAAASRWLGERGLDPDRLAVVHPSSGSSTKNWPVERFESLRVLAEGEGFDLLWICGPADEEVIASLCRMGDAVARGLDLTLVGAITSRARVYIGNDSGITHLAASSGARVVALFGPTDPTQWAPRGQAVCVTKFDTSAEEVWGFARELMRLS